MGTCLPNLSTIFKTWTKFRIEIKYFPQFHGFSSAYCDKSKLLLKIYHDFWHFKDKSGNKRGKTWNIIPHVHKTIFFVKINFQFSSYTRICSKPIFFICGKYKNLIDGNLYSFACLTYNYFESYSRTGNGLGEEAIELKIKVFPQKVSNTSGAAWLY